MVINPNEYGSLLFDECEENAVLNVMKDRMIFRYAKYDSLVDEFESQLANYLNTKHALGVINGTAGLITALVGCGVKAGDRVLVSSYTFLATALAVKNIGAIPVPVDIDLTNGMDENDLEEQLSIGAKAIIVVQLQGRCYNLDKVLKLAHKYKAYVIEDSCQALGAMNDTKYAGTIGDVGVYSFQQFKQITCGEGGAVVTDNESIYKVMRNYTDMGSNRDGFPYWNGDNVVFGQNYRMNNISAAIMIEQLKKLPNIIKKQHNSRNNILNNVNSNKIINSYYPDGDTGMNILLLLDSIDEFKVLKENGLKINIEVRKMWNGLYFENELFTTNKLTDIDIKNKECKISKDIVSRLAVISIPPILTEDNEKEIIDFLKNNL